MVQKRVRCRCSSSVFFCCWQKSQYRTSSAFIPAFSALVYSVQMNCSQDTIISADKTGAFPSSPKLAWCCSLSRSASYDFFFPIPNNELTESHPVNAWNPGNASHTGRPKYRICFAWECIVGCLLLLFLTKALCSWCSGEERHREGLRQCLVVGSQSTDDLEKRVLHVKKHNIAWSARSAWRSV